MQNNRCKPKLSIIIGDRRASLSSSTQTHLLNLPSQSQLLHKPTIRSPTISDHLQSQNKSECLTSHLLPHNKVHSNPNQKSKWMQRKSNASRLNYKNHKSNTNNAKLLNSKNETNKIESKKKKRQNPRKFVNFKCSVSNRKPKKPQRKLQQPRLSVNNKSHNILAFSSPKDQKYLQSTIHPQP